MKEAVVYSMENIGCDFGEGNVNIWVEVDRGNRKT
jgi:hypothetical protein